MGSTITFKCNLCNEIKEPKELLCVWWGWNSSLKIEKFDIKPDLKLSDRHICNECIDMVERYLN